MRKKKGKEGRKEKEKKEGGKEGEREKAEGKEERRERGRKGRREEGGVYRYVQCKSEPDEKGHKGTVCVKRLSHLPLP